MSYFMNTAATTDAEIIKERVTFNKDRCGTRVSIEYLIHHVLYKNVIDIKFGFSGHFVSTLHDGETGAENILYCRHDQ